MNYKLTAILIFVCLVLIAGCGITGTAKKIESQVSQAEFVQMKQLVVEQNETLKETNEYLKQIAINTCRIADSLETNDVLSASEVLDSMSRF